MSACSYTISRDIALKHAENCRTYDGLGTFLLNYILDPMGTWNKVRVATCMLGNRPVGGGLESIVEWPNCQNSVQFDRPGRYPCLPSVDKRLVRDRESSSLDLRGNVAMVDPLIEMRMAWKAFAKTLLAIFLALITSFMKRLQLWLRKQLRNTLMN